jgi:hypothetical protein
MVVMVLHRRPSREAGWAVVRDSGVVRLTPRHRFRHAEPSWFFNGQTTSFWASDTENELVRDVLGGILVASSSVSSV